MSDKRLSMALAGGQAVLPEAGTIAVLGAPAGYDLSGLPRDRTVVVTRLRPSFDHFEKLGYSVAEYLPDLLSATVVVLPRARDLGRTWIAWAAERDGVIIVDGAKTDGIDSIYREVAKRADVTSAWSKAHGKLFTISAGQSFEDWAVEPSANAHGFVTAPGVFSADGIDRASALLVETLPQELGKKVADLGAGWGYLSSQILASRDGIRELHLVEAEGVALDCAKANIEDPRAAFHWADATTWRAPVALDTVITNPPFHSGRAADPSIGIAFIEAAARNLSPKGQLFLVANRHLPYERSLMDAFMTCDEIAGDKGFKVLHASKPRRK